MLVRALRIKYIRNIEVYFVGCLYSLDLIHARKTEHIKIYQDVFQYHRIQRRRIGNSLLSLPRSGHTGGSVYGRWSSGPVLETGKTGKPKCVDGSRCDCEGTEYDHKGRGLAL